MRRVAYDKPLKMTYLKHEKSLKTLFLKLEEALNGSGFGVKTQGLALQKIIDKCIIITFIRERCGISNARNYSYVALKITCLIKGVC